MEVLVLASLIAAGYYINDKKKTGIETFEGDNTNSNIIPAHNDLYDTNNYSVSQQLQEVSAQDLISDIISGETNIGSFFLSGKPKTRTSDIILPICFG